MFDDEKLSALLRQTSRTNHPAPEPRLDAMWAKIERAAFGAERHGRRFTLPRSDGRLWWGAGIAAALAVGIGIGKFSTTPVPSATRLGAAADTQPTDARPSPSATVVPGLPDEAPYIVATTQYLGQTAALLSALPRETRRGAPDDAFLAQANELLSMTRLLLDSPAAGDPDVRVLLGDLELVLAQIARLSIRGSAQEVQLITEALETRDVLPRLRTAVAYLPPHIGL